MLVTDAGRLMLRKPLCKNASAPIVATFVPSAIFVIPQLLNATPWMFVTVSGNVTLVIAPQYRNAFDATVVTVAGTVYAPANPPGHCSNVVCGASNSTPPVLL